MVVMEVMAEASVMAAMEEDTAVMAVAMADTAVASMVDKFMFDQREFSIIEEQKKLLDSFAHLRLRILVENKHMC